MKLIAAAAFLLIAVSGVSAHQVPDGYDVPGFPVYEQIAPSNNAWTRFVLNGTKITVPENATVTTDGLVTDCRGSKNPAYWAFTFDDGPSPNTRKVLDNLKERNLKATFFTLGSSVMRYSGHTVRALSEGHELALHSWSHANFSELTNDQIVSELVWNARIIYKLTGLVPRYFRPTYGYYDTRTAALLKAMDIVPITWNLDTNDWKLNNDQLDTEDVQDIVTDWLDEGFHENGTISIQHDRFNRTANTSSTLIDLILGKQNDAAATTGNGTTTEDEAMTTGDATTAEDAATATGSSETPMPFEIVTVSKCICPTVHGPPYATSGRFYDIVVGNVDLDNPKSKQKCKWTWAALSRAEL